MKTKERFQGPLPDDTNMRWQLAIDGDPVITQIFNDSLERLDEKMKPVTDAFERSTQLTAEDYATYISPVLD